jgi:hypothetical protein
LKQMSPPTRSSCSHQFDFEHYAEVSKHNIQDPICEVCGETLGSTVPSYDQKTWVRRRRKRSPLPNIPSPSHWSPRPRKRLKTSPAAGKISQKPISLLPPQAPDFRCGRRGESFLRGRLRREVSPQPSLPGGTESWAKDLDWDRKEELQILVERAKYDKDGLNIPEEFDYTEPWKYVRTVDRDSEWSPEYIKQEDSGYVADMEAEPVEAQCTGQ